MPAPRTKGTHQQRWPRAQSLDLDLLELPVLELVVGAKVLKDPELLALHINPAYDLHDLAVELVVIGGDQDFGALPGQAASANRSTR